MLLSFSCNVSPHLREPKTVLDPGFHATDLGFQVLDSSLCQWNVDAGLQSLVGFRNSFIPRPRIPNSTSKYFTDSGFLIPLHGVKRFLVEFMWTFFWNYIQPIVSSLDTACNLTVTRLAQLVGTLLGRGMPGLYSRPDHYFTPFFAVSPYCRTWSQASIHSYCEL